MSQKEINFKSYFLFFLIFIFHYTFAIDNFDECGILEKKIKENHKKYSLDEPWEYSFKSVYFFKDTKNRDKYLRSKDNNLYLESIIPSKNNRKLIRQYPPMTEVIKINEREVKNLTDEDINRWLDLLEPSQKLLIQIRNAENNIRSFSVLKEDYVQNVRIESEVVSVGNIDSSNSSYDANIILRAYWYNDAFDNIVREANEEMFGTKEIKDPWYCEFTPDQWNKMKLFTHNVRYTNLISQSTEKQFFNYEIYYFPPANEEKSYVEIMKKEQVIGSFKGDFNFKAFPFDSQKIIFNHYIESSSDLIYPYFQEDILEETSGFENLKFNEWTKKDQSYNYIPYKDKRYLEDSYVLQLGINLERNYHYYLLKIFLPIMIILLVAWSCFWINPKELEARLTVSIVCLLTLIAYTFVIDKDLPKLSYMTIMDLGILVSYIFSTIPTFQTIYVHNQALADAKRIDKIFRIATPSIYILTFFYIFVHSLNGTTNVVEALTLR